MILRLLLWIELLVTSIISAEFINEYEQNDILCLEQIEKISQGLVMGDLWAVSVVDAWGKIPPGVISGNLNAMGHFDQCLAIKEDLHEDGIFRGQYCLMPFEIESISALADFAFKVFDLIRDSDAVINRSLDFPNATHDSRGFKFQLGVCIPSACSPIYFQTILRLIIKEYNLVISPTVTEYYCTTNESKPLTALDIFAIVVFSSFLALLLVSTLYDLVSLQFNSEQIDLLLMFSIYTNGMKLFSTKKSTSPETIHCLNGIRVLSIIWIVYGHSHQVYGRVPIYNPSFIIEWVSDYSSMLVISATVAVDSFFAISGLLICWLTLKKLDQHGGKLNLLVLYLHRYLRLTPVLAAMILFVVTLFRFLGSGPIWQLAVQSRIDPCEKNWWAALLYIQNYMDPKNMCLSESWYLSIDMQLFLLSPILITAIFKYGRKAIWTIMAVMLAVTAYIFIISYVFKFQMSPFRRDRDGGRRERMVYNATHTRMLAWLVGVILGFILHKMRNKTISLTKSQIFTGWSTAVSVMLNVIFGTYGIHQYDATEPIIISSLYEALHRTVWCVCLAWVIFACHHGFGGPVNRFLSLGIWQPISRLSYCIYLIHIEVQILRLTTLRHPVYLNKFNGIHAVWGDFGIAMTMAVIWTLAFESPIIVLERLFFARRKQQTNNLPLKEMAKENLTYESNENNRTHESDLTKS